MRRHQDALTGVSTQPIPTQDWMAIVNRGGAQSLADSIDAGHRLVMWQCLVMQDERPYGTLPLLVGPKRHRTQVCRDRRVAT